MWRQSTTLQEFATRLIVQWRHFPGRQVLFSAYAPLVVAIGGAVPISLWAYLRQQKMLMTELATAHGDTAKGETLDGLLVRRVTFTTVSQCPRELFCRSCKVPSAATSSGSVFLCVACFGLRCLVLLPTHGVRGTMSVQMLRFCLLLQIL